MDCNRNFIFNTRSSPDQRHLFGSGAIRSYLLRLAKALYIFHIITRQVPNVESKVWSLSLVEGSNMKNEFAAMCVRLGGRCCDVLEVLSAFVPVIETTSFVSGEVEGIDIGVGEVEEVEAHGRAVEVSISEKVINNIGAEGPFALALFFSFLSGGGLELYQLLFAHLCVCCVSLCAAVGCNTVMRGVRHDFV